MKQRRRYFMPSYPSAGALLLMISLPASITIADTIDVPADFATIQAAVDAAAEGDTVVVAPGVYTENITLARTVTLTSEIIDGGPLDVVNDTIIDGGGGAFGIHVLSSVGPETTITGFTIRNANDGVLAEAHFSFVSNKVTDTSDGIDYESTSGGLVRASTFENNSDDGIDLDFQASVTIEDSIIRNNGDDGIEIRLHDLPPDYSGPELRIVIRNNLIAGNGEDGIQLIDDETLSPRHFRIEGNLILNNQDVGLGMMPDMITAEAFTGADLAERVELVNNTFAGNAYAVTGGDNLIAVNNIFVDSANTALKRLLGDSIAVHNLFFGNNQDSVNSNVDLATSVFADPRLTHDSTLDAGSAATDAGSAFFQSGGTVVVDLASDSFIGTAPDIGALESQTEGQVLPVIPGALGFGMATPAGRGGQVYRVTTLADSGPGSLREALDASGPRIVIFEVGGEIQLASDYRVDDPYLTVAGQTAPSPGITLSRGTLRIRTHNVLVQHLRVRVGDLAGSNPVDRDGIVVSAKNGREVHDVVVDHCSVSWAIDESISTWHPGVHDVTIRQCIIAEGLSNSIHPNGEHSKGLLIGTHSKRVAAIGNLMVHNMRRNPRVSGDARALLVNNYIYNAGINYIHMFNAREVEPIEVSIVGNVLLPGPSMQEPARILVHRENTPGTLVYLADNEAPGATDDPWSVAVIEENLGFDPVATEPPIWIPSLEVLPSGDVAKYVTANAGARPADRDAVDIRIVNDVQNGTGSIIDSQEDVGGWPVLPATTRALTLPVDPNGDADGDGYTNIEEWLHQFAAEVEGTATVCNGGTDIDSDGVCDVDDNCLVVGNADQRDTDNDDYGNICDPDFDNSGVVNVVDLGIMRNAFFSADSEVDLNGDGVVNTVDLGIFKTFFFQAPGPSGMNRPASDIH